MTAWVLARASTVPESSKDEVERLVERLNDPHTTYEMRGQLGRALLDLGAPGINALILDTVRAPYTVAAQALHQLGKDAVPFVRAKWNDLTDAQRWRLMPFLGEFDYEWSLAFVLSSFKSPDPALRFEATHFISRHEELRGKDALLKLIRDEKELLVLNGAFFSLGRLDALRELLPVLLAELAPDSRYARYDGPYVTGGHPPNPPPWWPDQRPAVIQTLGGLKAKSSAPALLSVLREKGPGRAYLGDLIIPILGDLRFKESVPELRRILCTPIKDLEKALIPGAWIHIRAAQALRKLGDPSARPFLVLSLRSKDRDERRFAFEAFAVEPVATDAWLLIAGLDDGDDRIRALACQGLERIAEHTNNPLGVEPPSAVDHISAWKAWHRRNATRDALPKPAWTLSHLTAAPDQSPHLSDRELLAYWADLETAEGPRVFRAFLALCDAPRETVAFLKQRFRPIREPEEVLLDAKILRQFWAVAVLETIGTRDAAEVLLGLAQGAPAAWLTQEAGAALDKLTRPGRTTP